MSSARRDRSTCCSSSCVRTTSICLTLLNDRVRAIPGVRSTETFMYLRLRKQTYAWGTR